ncbi:hypothetical protein SDC9_209338 [bioreactor metagenome]|uniref:Uncharacterized protein n=1 Tax=bioreactor metagenome TaxID=1076179 RepID=A0A645JEU1_9ZZZZ
MLQAFGHVGKVGEKRAEFDCHRDADRRLHSTQDVQVSLLDLHGGLVHIRGDVIDVQFQRVGPCLLNGFGILGPTAR